MPALKRLGRLDRSRDFPLAVPDGPAQADPAGNKVDVIVVSIVVADGEPRGVLRKIHLGHEVFGDSIPLLVRQLLAGGQRQRGVPEVPLHVRAQRPHGGDLSGQLSRFGACQRAADNLRALQAGRFCALVH